MSNREVLQTIFSILMTAAAVKAALTTLSRPMAGQPKPGVPIGTRVPRLGPVVLEDYDDGDPEALDYEDLL